MVKVAFTQETCKSKRDMGFFMCAVDSSIINVYKFIILRNHNCPRS